MESKRILIVGAGFAGSTIANRLANKNYKVTVIDKRNHIGGNAYDFINQYGITIGEYGAHIFHTNNTKVYEFLSRFTEWIPYKHKVVSKLPSGELVVFPPTKKFVDDFGIEYVKNTFYAPYTKKMWGLNIEDIDSSILARVPVRNDDGDLYFPKDKYQFLPKNGYTALIKNMLTHENINVILNVPFDKKMEREYDHIFNSMPIDEYYNYIHGELPYRSIKFEHTTHNKQKITNHVVINFTDDGPHTRIIEWKNFPGFGLNDKYTTTTLEMPCDYKDNNMERYYPVKDVNDKNRETYKKYCEIKNNKTTFIGRCGMYVYIDMDQAVSSSLNIVNKFLKEM